MIKAAAIAPTDPAIIIVDSSSELLSLGVPKHKF